MNSSGLKAREIEALVYLQRPQPTPAEGSRWRFGSWLRTRVHWG